MSTEARPKKKPTRNLRHCNLNALARVPQPFLINESHITIISCFRIVSSILHNGSPNEQIFACFACFCVTMCFLAVFVSTQWHIMIFVLETLLPDTDDYVASSSITFYMFPSFCFLLSSMVIISFDIQATLSSVILV